MKIIKIEDFSNPYFQAAFQAYFQELEIDFPAEKWPELFAEMNSQGGNFAFLAIENDTCLGFIQARNEKMSHWFFEERFGFIREFWVDPRFRNQHVGSKLLSRLEKEFLGFGLKKILLTVEEDNDALTYYLQKGFTREPGILSKNEDIVMSKFL